jgi:hypothetical protein
MGYLFVASKPKTGKGFLVDRRNPAQGHGARRVAELLFTSPQRTLRALYIGDLVDREQQKLRDLRCVEVVIAHQDQG